MKEDDNGQLLLRRRQTLMYRIAEAADEVAKIDQALKADNLCENAEIMEEV